MKDEIIRSVALAAMLLAVPPLARAGCWDNCCGSWSEYKAACECSGGTPHKAGGGKPMRCEGGGGGGGYVPPPVTVDPRIRQNERYSAVLQAGGGAGVIDANYFNGLPTATDDDFARALTLLHTHLHRSAALSDPSRNYYAAMSAAALAARNSFYAPRFAMMDPSGVEPSIRAANVKARDAHAALETEIARVKDLRERFGRSGAMAAASSLHLKEGRAAKKSLWAHFGGITRAEAESFTESLSWPVKRDACCEQKDRPLDSLELQSPPDPAYDPAVMIAAEALSKATLVVIPPALTGDFDSRLAVVEGLQIKAAAARAAEAAARGHYERFWAKAGDRTAWEEILSTNRRFLEDTHLHWQLKIPQAKAELKEVLGNFDSETRAFYLEGGRAVAWSLFKKKMLFPELKRVGMSVFHGRPFELTDAQVEHAWKLDKHAVFGAYKDYSRAKKGYNLYETAKRIEGSFQEGALAMTDLTGLAEVGDYQGLGDRMTMGVDSSTREELQRSLKRVDIPEAWRNLWIGHFTGAKP